MSLYCGVCRAKIPDDYSFCPRGCGGVLFCDQCRSFAPQGSNACPQCSGPPRAVVRSTPLVAQVPDRYVSTSGRVTAEVFVPTRDVEILGELCQMVGALNQLAARLTQLTGLSEHTRKLVRDMRVLAVDAAEEIETRRGPG